MNQQIPASFIRAIKNRNGLLWVCQRYDLALGREPHNSDLPASEAILRYRKEVSAVDETLASLFWEAVWLEGAASPVLQVFRQAAEATDSAVRRPLVTLADAFDANANVTSEFLPICSLPGIIDDAVPVGSRYGATKRRARDRIAWDLGARLGGYQGRTLVVVGARSSGDLEFLYEILEDNPIRDLHVIVVFGDQTAPSCPENPAIDVVFWRGTEQEFLDVLKEVGAPSPGSLPEWSVRCCDKVLKLTPRDVQRIERRYVLITEDDLHPTEQFTMEDLHDFLSMNLSTWAAYANGIPVQRTYRTKNGKSLTEEVLQALTKLTEMDDSVRTFLLKVPADPGAGVTTLLRMAAFRAAEEGFPTLVLRLDQVDIDQNELFGFASALTEAALRSGLKAAPPFLLVIDVEHETLFDVGQIVRLLASQGRQAVILQAISSRQAPKSESRTRRTATLSCLTADATPEDVKACARKFSELASRWGLLIDVPSYEHWLAYSKAMQVATPDGAEESRYLFWIALRFFIVEGMELIDAEQALDELGAWIEKRVNAIEHEPMRKLVLYVAALSSFRLACPLWTVLRPVTGGSFSSLITAALRQLEGVVIWGGSSDELGDQVLRFAHPGLAIELLRRHSARTRCERLGIAKPVILGLSAGHRGDVWLAESIAASVLTPTYEERNPSTDYDWRLEVFDSIPPVISSQSKTILHHWARCLYLSVAQRSFPDLSPDIRRLRYKQATENLKQAIGLPRRSGRNEIPSHLYNTLGTACSRYARFLKEQGNNEESEMIWRDAFDAFRNSIQSGPNLEALLAFAHRLLARATESTAKTIEEMNLQMDFVADALSYLDEAEELLSDHPNPDPEWEDDLHVKKSQALSFLDTETGRDYLQQLESVGHSSIAAYCRARLALGHGDTEQKVADALNILTHTEEEGTPPTSRFLLLYLSLMRQHKPERFDFDRQLTLYMKLEALSGFSPRPIDQFRQAVLCYQTGRYEDGKNRFKKLRELVRREGGPQFFAKDIWHDLAKPSKPRLTQIRITRFVTEWRADGYVEELGQEIPLKPRHFTPMPEKGKPVTCVVRFTPFGPLAVPPRFESSRSK